MLALARRSSTGPKVRPVGRADERIESRGKAARASPFRLTVGGAMALIAAGTLLIGGGYVGLSEAKRAAWRERRDLYAIGEEDVIAQVLDRLAAARIAEESGPDGQVEARALRDQAEALARLAGWHAQLRRKYDQAMADPWKPVAADPPPPP